MAKELNEQEKKQRHLKLSKIEKSKKWKTFIEKYKNKAENIENSILAEIENWTMSKDILYSEDDLNIARIKAFKEIKEDLPELDWIEYFTELLDDFIKLLYNNIKSGFLTTNWIPLSKPQFTIKEYNLTKANEYSRIDLRFLGLKNSLEKVKEEEKKEEIY